MCLYLHKRNSTYYYRVKVPSDLRFHLNKEHIVKSLKTRDLNAAKISASVLNAQVQNSFALIRSQGFELIQKQQVSITKKSAKKGSISLSELIDMYVSEKSSNWTQRTTDDFKGKFAILLRVIGNVTADQVNRETCIKCRDTLLSLPKNFTKKKAYQGKSIKELMSIKDAPRLSAKTVNMYLIQLSSVFKWATKYGHIEINPAEGLLITNKTKKNEERKAYTDEDIQLIFNALPYSPDEPEKYWIPRIARYSGMRLEEICQLHKNDFKVVDGIPCLDVNNHEGKKLKTLASKRLLPIHPSLIKAGLLDYMKSVNTQMLWTELTPDKYGRYGKAYGSRYGRLNRKLISDTQKCFHSFRHTVADKLKQAGVKETLIIELLGHDDPKITTGRYGKNYKPAVLLEALNRL